MRGLKMMVAAFAALAAPVVSAGTVNFNFTGSVTASNSLTFSDAMSGLTATAKGFAGSNQTLVTRSGFGLGVYQGLPGLLDLIVDGIGGTETLLVDFTPNLVTINSATFGLVEANDDVRVTVFGPGGSVVASQVFDPTNGSSVTLDLTAFDETLRTGLSFGFSSAGFNDDFSVSGISVNYTPAAVVPLPAAVWAGMALLGASGMMSRRMLKA